MGTPVSGAVYLESVPGTPRRVLPCWGVSWGRLAWPCRGRNTGAGFQDAGDLTAKLSFPSKFFKKHSSGVFKKKGGISEVSPGCGPPSGTQPSNALPPPGVYQMPPPRQSRCASADTSHQKRGEFWGTLLRSVVSSSGPFPAPPTH